MYERYRFRGCKATVFNLIRCVRGSRKEDLWKVVFRTDGRTELRISHQMACIWMKRDVEENKYGKIRENAIV